VNQYCQICRTYHEIRSAPCTGSVTTYAPIDINAEIVARDATIAELRATIDRLLGADAQWEYAKYWRDKAEKAEARIAELEAIGTVLANGYDSGTMVNYEISLHYETWEQAEKAFELLTNLINASIAAAKPNPQGERRTE